MYHGREMPQIQLEPKAHLHSNPILFFAPAQP